LSAFVIFTYYFIYYNPGGSPGERVQRDFPVMQYQKASHLKEEEEEEREEDKNKKKKERKYENIDSLTVVLRHLMNF
jgi:hypothetical protein